VYCHLFPKGDNVAEMEAAEHAFVAHAARMRLERRKASGINTARPKLLRPRRDY